jgi:cystathionine beta-lyase/cystathionine gamma-synthase
MKSSEMAAPWTPSHGAGSVDIRQASARPSSGFAAISTTLIAALKAGDHLLVCDNVYRSFSIPRSARHGALACDQARGLGSASRARKRSRHAIWKRDFSDASGLFSIVLKPKPQAAVDALLDNLKLFGMGYS